MITSYLIVKNFRELTIIGRFLYNYFIIKTKRAHFINEVRLFLRNIKILLLEKKLYHEEKEVNHTLYRLYQFK
jgi:hypothetical protein